MRWPTWNVTTFDVTIPMSVARSRPSSRIKDGRANRKKTGQRDFGDHEAVSKPPLTQTHRAVAAGFLQHRCVLVRIATRAGTRPATARRATQTVREK